MKIRDFVDNYLLHFNAGEVRKSAESLTEFTIWWQAIHYFSRSNEYQDWAKLRAAN